MEDHNTARDERSIAVEGLAEGVLNVHDLDGSLAFHRDVLGLQVISPPQA